MKASIAIVLTVGVLVLFCAAGAGCICPGPGSASPPPTQVTPAVTPTTNPKPQPEANLTGWGTDRETYARGDTANGWVDVLNTGSVPIDRIEFTIVIKRTILFLPVEKTFSYNATDLDIQPGKTKKVQFSQVIPAEYSGVSTAGDYQFMVTASIAGKEAGSFTRSVKVT
jgi:hypothetical protein